MDFGTINTAPTHGSFAIAGFNDAPTQTQDRNFYGQIGDTIVVNPSLFIDARYGATRTNTHAFSGNHSGFTNYAAFGISPATQALFAKVQLLPGKDGSHVTRPAPGVQLYLEQRARLHNNRH